MEADIKKKLHSPFICQKAGMSVISYLSDVVIRKKKKKRIDLDFAVPYRGFPMVSYGQD